MKNSWRLPVVFIGVLLAAACCLRAAEGDAADDSSPAQPGPAEEAGREPQEQGDFSATEEQGQPHTDDASVQRQEPVTNEGSRAKDHDSSVSRQDTQRARGADSRREDRGTTRGSRRDPGGRGLSGGPRRRDSRTGSALAETGGSSNSGRGVAAFKLITERNIFDSTRSARVSRSGSEPRRRSSPETLTLVGTMSYEKGAYAFFDGSKSEYRKALEIGASIANHKVLSVATDAVTLQAQTNTFELRIGGQLRKGEGGWETVAASAPARETSSTASTPSSSSSALGDEDEVIRRLMQQRERELK